MKKYLGSKIDACIAVLAPMYLCGFLLVGICILIMKAGNGTAMLLAIVCVAIAIIIGLFLMCMANELYSWGFFQNDRARIKKGFSKRSTLVYEKCRSCGIGFYTHRAVSLDEGTKVYFIFLAYDTFCESYRSKINFWKTSANQIKVEYSIELYEYLLSVLPKEQSQMLLRDYEKYIKNRFRSIGYV